MTLSMWARDPVPQVNYWQTQPGSLVCVSVWVCVCECYSLPLFLGILALGKGSSARPWGHWNSVSVPAFTHFTVTFKSIILIDLKDLKNDFLFKWIIFNVGFFSLSI